MKFFPLNNSIVQKLRHNHPALIGRRLHGSGKFSGIFEGSTENSVLKLSIDKASYIFNTNNHYKNKHFIKLVKDYGQVGIYSLHHNMKQPKSTHTNLIQVPIYLYEVEKLNKITSNTKNHELARYLVKNWQKYNALSCSDDLKNSVNNFVSHLRSQSIATKNFQSIIDALDQLKTFMNHCNNESAFFDLHSTNMMQREDGTLVFSDPIADFQIYSYYYRTYKTQ
ncbi:hypothetical protein HYG93_08665 [Acinetobacter sp. SwsAc6]|uniref:hypothetical protein n=1 Tax=Acinetobacter sp. SwsAc6 TaxID=2749439 RepID=UPI0015C06394|nr:hypothetical protein [Acinetobacter sp. SwsAc6]NWK74363.1 hypothetical protein [Acinetobacter sp. SwsAc6]